MKFNITDKALQESARKFRKELLLLPVISLENSTKHLTVRPGITYSELVGAASGKAELRPYTGDATSDVSLSVSSRELRTYLGQCVDSFDPNEVVSTIYGSSITSGASLKDADIAKFVLAFVMKNIGAGLNASLFSAKRNDSGTTTAELFDGFDTITQAEIDKSAIASSKGNLFEYSTEIDKTNAVDVLKSFYFSASDELQDARTKLYISRSIYNLYCEDYKTTTGATPYNREYECSFLEGSSDRCELVPLSGKKDSKYLHLTTQQNMLVGVDQMSDKEKLFVDRFSPFKLTLSATMFFGAQFESIDKSVFCVAKKQD